MGNEILIIISAAVSAIVAFITSLISISYKIGKITGIVEQQDKRINNLENRFENFLTAMFVPKDRIDKEMKPYIDKLDEIIEEYLKFKKGENPVSKEEIDRIKTYRNKIVHGVPLTPKEYEDFESIGKKIKEELPEEKKDDFEWALSGLLGFSLGFAIASLLKKEGSKEAVGG